MTTATETKPVDLQRAGGPAPLLEKIFFFDVVEDSYAMTGITGRIPKWLRGSYYINGPARFELAGKRYKHWLDGDGMVCSVRFDADGVHFTNKFVDTQKLRDENKEGKFLYREFGTAFQGDRLHRKVMLEPPVNVSVYPYNGKVLAFGEQSLPMELDPITLETRGEYSFGDSLNEVTPFAAHAKTDPANGHLLNFGISFSATEPMLNVFEFDPSGNFLRRRRHKLQYQHSNHDFGFTPNFVAFYLSPLIMDFQRFWSAEISVMESLQWKPETGSRILIAPRIAKGEAFTVEIEPRYCLHLINCFEDGKNVIVDVLEMERPIYGEYQTIPDLFTTVPPCRPARFVIDTEAKRIVEKITMSYDCSPDFPAVDAAKHGAPYNDFWMLGITESGKHTERKFFDQLVRGSWKHGEVCDSYTAPWGEYLGGEPIAVVNPDNSDDVVVMVQHAIPAEERDEFLLFDGHSLKSGPIARMPLKHRVHPGFHTSFHFA